MNEVEVFAAPILPTPPLNKWRREQAEFRRLLPELLKTHRGQYVAIHEEKVADYGTDQLAVAQRVYARFGYISIYESLVTDQVIPIRMPSRRLLRADTVQ